MVSPTITKEDLAHRLGSDKPVDTVVENIEKLAGDYQFRVLAVHDVQQTLKEKGFEREPLKIVEICSAKFAHEALKRDIDVAMFMPCRYTVYQDGDKTMVTLARPMMIAQMIPEVGLEPLSEEVETILKKIMEEAV